jgi:hypothetical protein
LHSGAWGLGVQGSGKYKTIEVCTTMGHCILLERVVDISGAWGLGVQGSGKYKTIEVCTTMGHCILLERVVDISGLAISFPKGPCNVI